jgi:NNP family nitrate/nitrite transporter-like MFS transporter
MTTFEPRGNGKALALATVAFTVSFYAWSMLGPLGPDLQDLMGLSELQLAMMIAVPVLMGSLMRVPLGPLTERLGGRVVFTSLMAFTLVPLAALAIWHDSYIAVIAFGFFLGFAGAAFAVGVPFVNRWYPAERKGMALGIYGMGMGGTVLAGLTAPRIADRWGLTAPFVVAIVLICVAAGVFWLLARDAPAPRAAAGGGMFSAFRIYRERPAAWAPTFYSFHAFGGFVALFA